MSKNYQPIKTSDMKAEEFLKSLDSHDSVFFICNEPEYSEEQLIDFAERYHKIYPTSKTQDILIQMGFTNTHSNVWDSDLFGVFLLHKDATPKQLAEFIYRRGQTSTTPKPQEISAKDFMLQWDGVSDDDRNATFFNFKTVFLFAEAYREYHATPKPQVAIIGNAHTATQAARKVAELNTPKPQDTDDEYFIDDEYELHDCPRCGRTYDDADDDFKICHHCGYDASNPAPKPQEDKGVSDEEKNLLKEFIEYAYENIQLNDNNRETFANLYANASNIVDGLCAEKAQVTPKPQEINDGELALISATAKTQPFTEFKNWFREKYILPNKPQERVKEVEERVKQEIRDWLIGEDYEGLAERI